MAKRRQKSEKKLTAEEINGGGNGENISMKREKRHLKEM